jgi:hypothetical protein
MPSCLSRSYGYPGTRHTHTRHERSEATAPRRRSNQHCTPTRRTAWERNAADTDDTFENASLYGGESSNPLTAAADTLAKYDKPPSVPAPPDAHQSFYSGVVNNYSRDATQVMTRGPPSMTMYPMSSELRVTSVSAPMCLPARNVDDDGAEASADPLLQTAHSTAHRLRSTPQQIATQATHMSGTSCPPTSALGRVQLGLSTCSTTRATSMTPR